MSRSLNVLSLATLFPDASRPNFGIFVERSLASLARQAGVSLTVLAPVGLPPWPLSRHPRYRAQAALPMREDWHGLTVLRPRFRLWPGMGAARNGPAIAAAVLPLVRQLHAAKPFDVVDAQFFHPDGPAAQHIAAALGLPYSVKARGADISLWARRADTGPALLDAARHAAGLLAVAASLREEMIALGMPAERISVHHTGVDATRFRPLDRAAARTHWGVGDGPAILTVGALIPRKAQADVIAALPQLSGLTYLIAGTGPDATALTAHAQALGVGDRVRLLGAVPNADLPTLYNAADAMVLPSRSEGLANAWVEALACGTPLVLSDIPPAHDIIDAPDAGRIAGAGTDALADAIRATIAAAPDRTALHRRVTARFNWEQNGEQLANHLQNCAQFHSSTVNFTRSNH